MLHCAVPHYGCQFLITVVLYCKLGRPRHAWPSASRHPARAPAAPEQVAQPPDCVDIEAR